VSLIKFAIACRGNYDGPSVSFLAPYAWNLP
jgi:hypothetical protein